METKELKSLIHESIENIDDEKFLQTLKQILDHKYDPSSSIDLNDYQEQRIKQAKESINKGEYLTNEEADELVAKWLNA